MERHGDHGTDLVQIHLYETVIVGYLTGVQFLIFFGPSVDLVELTDLVVGLPDRGQAGGLCGHNISRYGNQHSGMPRRDLRIP